MTPGDETDSYEVEVVRNTLIPAKGVELAADLYLPKGAAPSPALVVVLPYNKDWNCGMECWQAHHYFARHGYPCVLVDFRGTGNSSGATRAAFDAAESDDGIAAIEWASKQPWCSGQVGMWGMSYGGIITLRTASRQPAALKAIIPIMGTADVERDLLHPYGTPGCLCPLSWLLQMIVMHLMPPQHMDNEGRWRKVWEERLGVEPYITELLRHPCGDPVWRARAIDVTRIAVPSFCVVGWRDLFADGMTRAFEQIRAPKKLLAGPWMHVLPQESSFCTTDFLPMMRRWWDRWLRGIQNGIEHEPQATVYVQGGDRWRNLSTWPAAEVKNSRWFAGMDGHLQDTPVRHAGIVQKPPDATVGVGAGLPNFHSSGYGMPVDESDDDRRGISFTSSALRTTLLILGRARLRLGVNTENSSEGTVVAKLADVHPDGRSVFITAGVSSLSSKADDGTLLIEFAPSSYELAPGHRLRLMIANGDFPWLWPDPNPPELLIRCGGATMTELDVPLAPPDIGKEASVQAADPSAARPPHLLEADPPYYEVTRDPNTDSVTVAVANGTLSRSMDFTNTIRFKWSLSATTTVRKPDGASFTGSASAEITTPQGPIHVRARTQASRGFSTAEGEITVGGITIFTRRWGQSTGPVISENLDDDDITTA
jgi:uncharacterized protein